MTLQEFFVRHPRVALGFSGGVDSSYLLYAAIRAGAAIRAYYVKSPFQPAFELADARRLAEELGADLQVLEADPLEDPQVAANPQNRCYFCKIQIFSRIQAAARADGFPVLLDGTNASDDVSDRPGFRALQELEVLSPLRLCGLTKPEIRRLSREAGLFTWDKPAYACLATRSPTGVPITRDHLANPEAAEAALFALGFRDFRVRWLDGRARLQLREEQLPLALENRARLLEALRPYYSEILLDLEVRP